MYYQNNENIIKARSIISETLINIGKKIINVGNEIKPFELEKEIQTFEKNRASLFAKYPNKWALIRGDVIEGIFTTQQEGITTGYNKFGNTPFAVQHITEKPEVIFI